MHKGSLFSTSSPAPIFLMATILTGVRGHVLCPSLNQIVFIYWFLWVLSIFEILTHFQIYDLANMFPHSIGWLLIWWWYFLLYQNFLKYFFYFSITLQLPDSIIQGGAKVVLQLWVHEIQFILVSLCISYRSIFHTNSCKPTLPHPVLVSGVQNSD